MGNLGWKHHTSIFRLKPNSPFSLYLLPQPSEQVLFETRQKASKKEKKWIEPGADTQHRKLQPEQLKSGRGIGRWKQSCRRACQTIFITACASAPPVIKYGTSHVEETPEREARHLICVFHTGKQKPVSGHSCGNLAEE